MANSVLAKMAVQISANTAEFNRRMAESAKSLKKVEESTKQTSSVLSKFGSIIGTAGIAAAVGSVAKAIFDLGVKAEQTKIAFTTFLGSASKAKVLLEQLNKFSIETPFTPDQVNNAAKSLLAFGVQADEIIPTLKMIGDVSAGTGKDLAEMAIIFGQIRSTGRLMGQDLLQLINAGFNPLQVISEQTGKSVAVLKKEMEKGLITFDMVSNAFKTATSEGGLFFNLMENQSKTVGGLLSTIQGNLEEIGKKIYENNNGGLTDLVRLTADLTSNIEGVAAAVNGWIKASLELSLFYQLVKFINTEAKEAAEGTKRVMRELLSQQTALLKTNQTLEERKKTMQTIVFLEKELGIFKPATTEDPLPWVTDKKVDEITKITTEVKKLTTAFADLKQVQIKVPTGDSALLSLQKDDVSQGKTLFGSEKEFDSTKDSFFKRMDAYVEKTKQTASQISNIIEVDLIPLFANMTMSIADGFGRAIAGVGSFGDAILKSVIGFARQLGEILVAAGYAMLKAKLLIKNPIGAIAAGTALIAVAGFASARLNAAQRQFNGGGGGRGIASTIDSLSVANNNRIELYAKGTSLQAVLTETSRKTNRTRSS